MKIFVLAPQEGWICDRFTEEWYQYNQDISTKDIMESDIVWLLADWCWNHVPKSILISKKVVCTTHHIVPNKFGEEQMKEFMDRDQYIDVYHVPCEKTKEQIKDLTNKPIFVQPFWVNGELWKDLSTEEDRKSSGPMTPVHYIRRKRLKKEMGLSDDVFLIGSFQRDTEGSDLLTPKLEKGPDVFVDFVALAEKELKKSNMTPIVLLGGWRRQYIKRRLMELGIRYIYKELPSFEELNKMYNSLDLYVVGSRFEGGPQSIFECASNNTPIVSTDVGGVRYILDSRNIASEVSGESLLKCFSDVEYAYKQVQKYLIPHGFAWFQNIFKEVIKL